MKTHLSISGGATDIVTLAGCVFSILEKGFEPNSFSGVSAGAILSLPLALKKYNQIENLVRNFTLDTIFDKKPVGKKGGVSAGAIARVAFGANSFGTYENLRKTLTSVVSKDDFAKLDCDVFVGVTNYTNGNSEIHNIRNYSYEDAISFVIASASIPIFAPPVFIKGSEYFDGGIRDHCIANKLLDQYDFEELVTIYVRDTLNKSQKPFVCNDILSIAERTIQIRSSEISLSDQRIESEICHRKGIKYQTFNLVGQMDSYFDCDKANNLKGWQHGKEVGLGYK